MNYWINITSGRGPEECSLFVKKITPIIMDYCKKNNIKAEILSIENSDFNNYKSVLISVESDNLQQFSNDWNGTIQWICQSPYRINHKRKNWFIGIEFIKTPEKNNFDLNDIEIETMRSTGAGGQNVNKTDSAVRIKHIPSGITVIAREERSQQRNKKLAFSRLNIALENQEKQSKDKSKQNVWDSHNELIRGNPIKTYKGIEFKLNND
jgi:peptide chain release factor